MNNIQDNPARVAPPEPPKGFSIDEAKFDLIENYLDSDVDVDVDYGAFHECLETYIVENCLIHYWMRKMYTRNADEVQLDMQDILNSVVSNYVEITL